MTGFMKTRANESLGVGNRKHLMVLKFGIHTITIVVQYSQVEFGWGLQEHWSRVSSKLN